MKLSQLGAANLPLAGTEQLVGLQSGADVLIHTSDLLSPYATQAYVNAIAQGLSPKESVAAATAAALPANVYSNGASGVGATLTATANGALVVDSTYTALLNDRIAVLDEATGANDGIYVVTQAGGGAAPYILTRATDSDTPAKLAGAYFLVEQGGVNIGGGFVLPLTAAEITVGTTALNFVQFSGAGEITAGTGLTKSGNTLSLSTPVALNLGGTAASLTASNGGLVYSTASAMAVLAATATARQIPLSGASAAPSWSSATYPATTTSNQLLYSSASNTIGGLSTANGGLLNTSSSGVPSITATPTLGVAGSTVGSIGFANATSGTVTLQPATGALGSAVLTLPAATDTVALLAATQTLTSKTLASPALSGTVTGNNTIPLSILAQIGAGTVLGNNGGSTANVAATSTPVLGVAGSTVGSIGFANATSGTVTLQPTTGALGSAVLTLPAATDTVALLAATQTLTSKTFSGGTLSGTIAGTPTLSGANFVTRANLAQVAASSLSGNPTGALANESAITLGATLNFSGTTLNATTATASLLGVVKPDGTTITISAGVLTAIGATASSITVGTTTIASGTSNGLLYDNGGALGNLATANGGILNTSSSGVPSVTATPTLGVAGGTVGSLSFANATSGTIKLQPTTGALGTVTLTLQAVNDIVAVLGTSQTHAATQTFSGALNVTGNFQLGGVNQIFPASTIIVGTTDTQTLSNKTLTNPVNGSANGAYATQTIVSYNVNSGSIMAIANTNNTSGNHGLDIGVGPNSSDTSSSLIRFFDSGSNTPQGAINRNGSGAVAYATSSDIRGKPHRELLSAEIARSIVDRLRIWDFDKDGNAIRGVGVIAQEAYEVLPSMVHRPKDPDAWWSAEKAAPVPYLVANMQWANLELSELAARVALLEAARSMSD